MIHKKNIAHVIKMQWSTFISWVYVMSDSNAPAAKRPCTDPWIELPDIESPESEHPEIVPPEIVPPEIAPPASTKTWAFAWKTACHLCSYVRASQFLDRNLVHQLQKAVAVMLLSMHTTSCSAERNWSKWGLIYEKNRARLARERAMKMIFLTEHHGFLLNEGSDVLDLSW